MRHITSRLVTITPALAKAMLLRNTSNRSVKKGHVDTLARDMAAGRWVVNGSTIVVREDGEIADGQHRLYACVQSGVSFDTFLVEGVKEGAIFTIDQGVKRSAGDQFTIQGEKNATRMAATLRTMAIMATRQYGLKLTQQELQEILANHPDVRDSVVECRTLIAGIPQSLVASIHYVGSVIQGLPDEANAFVGVLATGVPSYEGDPAHLARERFIAQRGRSVRWQFSVQAKLLMHTWNLFAAKRSMKVLRDPDDVALDGWDAAALHTPVAKVALAA